MITVSAITTQRLTNATNKIPVIAIMIVEETIMRNGAVMDSVALQTIDAD